MFTPIVPINNRDRARNDQLVQIPATTVSILSNALLSYFPIATVLETQAEAYSDKDSTSRMRSNQTITRNRRQRSYLRSISQD